MAKTKIFKKDGTPTAYFWTDKDGEEKNSVTVYKKTADGVKRMRGVHFNTITGLMKRD
jgi:hypothetical protein